MPSSLEQFRQSFSTELARPNRYLVNILDVPSTGGAVASARQLQLRCETAEIPGKTFVTADQKFGSAPVQKFPYMHTYQDLTLTFIVSEDMSEKAFFDTWFNFISQNGSYNFQYRNSYSSPIIVTQFNQADQMTYQVQMNDCYPIAINQLDLDWSSTDTHHKLTVVFAYTDWDVLFPTLSTASGDTAVLNVPSPSPSNPYSV